MELKGFRSGILQGKGETSSTSFSRVPTSKSHEAGLFEGVLLPEREGASDEREPSAGRVPPGSESVRE